MSEVPEGTIDEVLEWVGGDPERANAAYEAEVEGKGRTTLLSTLQEIVSDTDDADVEPEPAAAPAPKSSAPKYFALKRLRMQGGWIEVGEQVPGADEWPRLESWIRQGWVRREQ